MIDEVRKLKALSCTLRLRILTILRKKREGLFVCDLTEILNEPQYTVTKHLAVLKEAGLVRDERHGKSVRYILNEESGIFQDFLKNLNLSSYVEFANDNERLKTFGQEKHTL